MSPNAPCWRLHVKPFIWLALVTTAYLSATAHSRLIDAADCATLTSWTHFANYVEPASCFPLQDCSEYTRGGAYTVQCNTDGTVWKLELNGRGLLGSLPPQWAALTSLQYLEFSHNHLTGTIPPGWSAMTNLSKLYLNSNNLTGTLPPEWGTMAPMIELYVDNNQLTGTLPPEWSGMTALQELSLHDTALNGTLPTEWSAIANLNTLYVQETAVEGPIPKSWRSMTLMSIFNATGAQVCGSDPWPDVETALAACSPSQSYSPRLPVAAPSPPPASPSPPTSPLLSRQQSPQSRQESTSSKKALVIGAVAGVVALVAVCIGVTVLLHRHGCGRLQPPPLSSRSAKDAGNGAAGPGSRRGEWLSGAVFCLPTKPRKSAGHGAEERDLETAMEAPGGHHLSTARPPRRCHVIQRRGMRPVPMTPSGWSLWIGRSGTPHSSGGHTGTQRHRAGQAPSGWRWQHGPTSPFTPLSVALLGMRHLQGMAPAAGAGPASKLRSAHSLLCVAGAPAAVPGGGITAVRAHSAGPGNVPLLAQPGGLRAAPSVGSGRSAASYKVGPPTTVPSNTAAPGPQLALVANRGQGDGDGELAVSAALGVAIVLPKCMELASSIVAAGERVVANNARCAQLMARVTAVQPLLSTLQTSHDRGLDQQGVVDEQRLVPVLNNIHAVFSDVHECIDSWCASSRLGSIATVVRNLVAASWFQEGFLELNVRLSGAFTDLSTVMQIHDWGSRRMDRAVLLAEAEEGTKEDLQGLVADLVAEDSSGRDHWSTLEPAAKETVQVIFSHHELDLTSTVHKARQQALDKRVSRLLIDPGAVTKGRLIGQGGYGKVYEGVWKRTIPVALKWLEVGLLSERDKADIMREAYIHSCAHNHPNVCQLYGLVLQDPGECVLVMERLEQNLQQLLRDDAVVLLTQHKYRLALDAANGMEHLHSKNIVHGDLKPSNLLVGKNGSIVVTDFGLSSISCVSLTAATLSAAHPLLSSSSTALSVWYSPPELLDNRSTKKTPAGDVYAFAMVLLEIFTGQDPYGVAEYQAVLHIVLSGGRPKISDRVPPGCADLIRRCWDHDPEARPGFTEIVEALCTLADACA